MKFAKAYGDANSQIFTEAETTANADEAKDLKTLWIVSSSDRGLCGGIHSSVTKKFRKDTHAGQDSTVNETPLIILGDKSKAQLTRAAPKAIVLSFNQIGKAVPTFGDACAIASLIEDSGVQFDKVNLVYNKVISAVRLHSTLHCSEHS